MRFLRQTGVLLIEYLWVLGLIAFLAVLGAGSWQQMFAEKQRYWQQRQLQDLFIYARQQALLFDQWVVVRPMRLTQAKNNDWAHVGVFIGQHCLYQRAFPALSLHWQGEFHHRQSIVFQPQGGLDGQQGHFYQGKHRDQPFLIVSQNGRAHI